MVYVKLLFVTMMAGCANLCLGMHNNNTVRSKGNGVNSITNLIKFDYFTGDEECSSDEEPSSKIHAPFKVTTNYFVEPEEQGSSKFSLSNSVNITAHYISPVCLEQLYQALQSHNFGDIASQIKILKNCSDCLKKINEGVSETDKTILSLAVIELGKIILPKTSEKIWNKRDYKFDSIEKSDPKMILQIKNIILELRGLGADRKQTLCQISSKNKGNLFAYNALNAEMENKQE